MKALKLITLLFAATFTPTIHAMTEEKFVEAHAIYMTASNGNEEVVIDASKYFKKMSEQAPYDILVKTYLGSLESMMAEHVYMPWNKMKYVEIGSEQMDEALDELTNKHDNTTLGGTPLSVRMKTIVAHTYFRFPKFLNRYQDAKDIVAEILESSAFTVSSIDSKNNIYKLAADMAKEDENKEQQARYLAKIKLNK